MIAPYAADVLLPQLRDCYRRLHAGVPTVLIADLTGLSERAARNYLVALERAGEVERVGVKRGWVPADAAARRMVQLALW